MNKIKNFFKRSAGFIPAPNGWVRGFTMIELLVAISVFTVIIAATSGIFITSLRSNRASVALISANSDAQLTLEQMARVIRKGEGKTFASEETNDQKYRCLKFKSGNDFITYRWNRAKKNIEWNTGLNDYAVCDAPDSSGVFSGIISENLRVDVANFRVANAGFYPLITILLRVGSNATQIASAPFSNLEVSISPRGDKRD